MDGHRSIVFDPLTVAKAAHLCYPPAVSVEGAVLSSKLLDMVDDFRGRQIEKGYGVWSSWTE